jgi:hypothetical protein
MWGNRSGGLRLLCRRAAHCAAALALTSCTWVNLEKQGQKVELREASQIAKSCLKIAKVNARVRDTILLLRRSEQKISGELATLARNEAGELGGDTISAIAPPEDGRQSFDVYRCSLT